MSCELEGHMGIERSTSLMPARLMIYSKEAPASSQHA